MIKEKLQEMKVEIFIISIFIIHGKIFLLPNKESETDKITGQNHEKVKNSPFIILSLWKIDRSNGETLKEYNTGSKILCMDLL